MMLLGKVLPMQLVGNNGDDVLFTHIERVIIDTRAEPSVDTVSDGMPATTH